MVQSPDERAYVHLLIESIRSFGGAMRHNPFLIFEADAQNAPCHSLVSAYVQVIPLELPSEARSYYFAKKVYACAQAEKLAASTVQSLIWIDPMCLIVRPPLLFNLGQAFDTAVRPVHIKNVGLGADKPLDIYWQRIYKMLGVDDIQHQVETFVGKETIRAYFNTHAFAVNPTKGLLGRWLEYFTSLVADKAFQNTACPDSLHQIFLHQAIWSALLVTSLEPDRIHLLPPDYNYPYNLHHMVPPERRVGALNDLVCFTYEGRTITPDLVNDIAIHAPLSSWLADQVR